MQLTDHNFICGLRRYLPGAVLLCAMISGGAWADTEGLRIGDSPESVQKTQGTPTSITQFPRLHEEVWWYDASTVTFKEGKLYGYHDFDGSDIRLKIASPSVQSGTATFGIGSTLEDVYQAQGPPSRISDFKQLGEIIWWYEFASVTFRHRKVVEWDDLEHVLKVKIGEKKADAPPLRIGTTPEDLVALYGTPSRVSDFPELGQDIWWYGYSSFTFRNGIIAEWHTVGEVVDAAELRGTGRIDGDPSTADEIVDVTEIRKQESDLRGFFTADGIPETEERDEWLKHKQTEHGLRSMMSADGDPTTVEIMHKAFGTMIQPATGNSTNEVQAATGTAP